MSSWWDRGSGQCDGNDAFASQAAAQNAHGQATDALSQPTEEDLQKQKDEDIIYRTMAAELPPDPRIKREGYEARIRQLFHILDVAEANALPERPDARANVLADRCGQLLQENRELLAENGALRRKLEAAERKASKR